MTSKVFFEHISGLRAFAILAVILYHLDPRFHQHGFNGYLGVEIFFVISGFLLLKSLINDTDFSLKQFITKKVIRLYTPIIFILLLLLPFLLLTPGDFTLTASETALSTLLGVSNLWLKSQSGGYFNQASATNPLLHTWYVSVLMQMFIICGLGCAILKRCSSRCAQITLCIVGLLSFLWAHIGLAGLLLSPFFPDISFKCELFTPNYYDTLPRLWQLLSAAVIFTLPECRQKVVCSLISVAGLLLIAFPMLNFFPVQLHSLSVVSGTILIIKYVPHCFLNQLLTTRAVQYAGMISFSLYLVHVPIIVIGRQYFSIQTNTFERDAVLLAAILLAAVLFYSFVEKKKVSGIFGMLLFLATITLYGTAAYSKGIITPWQATADGLRSPGYHDFTPAQHPTILRSYAQDELPLWYDVTYIYESDYFRRHANNSLFVIGNQENPASFVLIGDSHAAAIYPGMDNMFKEESISGVYVMCRFVPFFSKTGALTGVGEKGVREQDYMQKREEALLSWLKEQNTITTVVVAGRWTRYLELKSNEGQEGRELQELCDMCERFRSIGKKVVLMTDIPEMPLTQPLNYSMQQMIFGKNPKNVNLSISQTEYGQHCKQSAPMLAAAEQQDLCKLLHVEEGLASGKDYFGVKEGKVLYYDDNHINADGAGKICRKLRQSLLNLLQP